MALNQRREPKKPPLSDTRQPALNIQRQHHNTARMLQKIHVFPIFLLLALLLLRQVVSVYAQSADRGPVPYCGGIAIPSQYAWNSGLISKSLTAINPPWSQFSYLQQNVIFGTDNATLQCDYSAYNATSNLTYCGFIQTRLNDTLGPFLKVDMDVEWNQVSLPQRVPGFMWQKKTGSGGVFQNDSIGVHVIPVNATTSLAGIYVSGANWTRAPPGQLVAGGQGRHSLQLIWDNQSVILFLDSQMVARIDRKASDPEWVDAAGKFNLFSSYDNAGIPIVSEPQLTGPNTSWIIYSMNMECISPYASDCYKPNPIPGIATCDLLTGTWSTPPGPVQLNTSSSTNSTNSEPILNVTSIVLQINGSLVIGGGIVIDATSVVNVTGDIVFRGILIINVTALSLNNTSVTIATYQNYSGQFKGIQLIGTPDSNCEKYYATPYYEVILSTDSSSCNKKHAFPPAAVIGVVVGALLLAIVLAVVLVVFCKKTSLFRHKPKRRAALSAHLLN